ncbi:MAG: PAS domain S-box protein, partial [candidate division NC10 bacterium]
QPFTIRYRIHNAKGEVRWVWERGTGIFDDGGRLRYLDGAIFDVTAQRRTEQALRESEERFRTVVDHSPTKIHIKDLEGRYLLVNKEAEELFGVTDEDARGRTSGEIFPQERAEAFGTHDRAVLEAGHAIEEEEEWLREDGAHTFLTVKFPIRDASGKTIAVGAIGTDITERKRVEAALRASEAKLRTVIDTAADGVMLIDATGTVQIFNRACERLFGYKADEVIGQNVKMLMPPPSRDEHDTYLKQHLQTGKSNIIGIGREVIGWSKDGSTIPLDVTIGKLNQGDEGIFVGILRDITERKRAEEVFLDSQRHMEKQSRELEELTHFLVEARDQAESANRAKSEFLANMSHELRTPLNAIIGFSELTINEMFGPVGNSTYLEYARDINGAGQHLLDLINDILDLCKIESGAGELREEDVMVRYTVRSVLTLVKERAREGGVELVLEAPDGLPALWADERKLKQILVNLLSNGIKFTNAGGRVVLKIWCRMDSGYVFQVIDTGIGMALEDIPTALAAFQQVDSDLDRKYEGTGLGLPLTKALVEMHGASLDLQSEVGVGTTVTVRFPAERIMAEPAMAAFARGRSHG